ncbi:glycoside hydrolase family 3 C-terminal domain-containing protein [Nocardia huaxiensis]|uniref:Glycoside hydrolase family 3 C-terminal domain-containing protein n=1 Tax=Nocardia huaxiensis TaxID=2755382 RepID=A0A7D6VH61_9NOCA|nr:glycoside hydrolase family 3 C-terminal domain-containing protein [Nocardia huaxiensis]QLY32697.1 glycoside hydrolase family 3 C-terminal domain-containing protein [Nocardia huaxiensis]
MDDRIDQLLAKLDLTAKLRLVSGAGLFRLAGEPVIGLAEMPISDGPSGVRGESMAEPDPSVSLPSGTAVAATWDPELLTEIGALIAAEARRKNVYAVLGPTINLHRSPLGGRHFECFSEDPLLTAEMAAAYVRAVQDHGVAACPKHYVANDSETERFSVDVQVSDRALRELYLYPFERAVEAGAWMIMDSYNGVNGTAMSDNPLLGEPLKGEWGFDGVVVSDWGGVRSTAAAAGGTDLCMPGPPMLWGEPLLAAIRAGEISEDAIDEKVRRILRFATRVGALDGSPWPTTHFSDNGARNLVRRLTTQSMVLVRNDGTLPLRTGTRVAVLGPAAAEPRIMGGGSATVIPTHISTPLAGLRAVLPVTHTPGVRLIEGLVPAPAGLTTDPEIGTPGVRVRYFDGATEIGARHSSTAHVVLLGDEIAARATHMELHGLVRADTAGDWQIGFGGTGPVRLDVDGVTVLDEDVVDEAGDPVAALMEPPQRSVTRTLTAGQVVDVRVTIAVPEAMPGLGVLLAVLLGIARPQRPKDEEFAAAVELARAAEVAVVVVGTSEKIESEGSDRTSLRLPDRQDELVAAVAAVNPRTVIVVNSGAPVEMPWRDDVAAVLLTWFPGQEFGDALANVLTGVVEPGGRLPTTWPRTIADVPVLDTTPEHGVLEYTEDIHIGYRAWLRAGAEPAYPFGHGLGYTTWSSEDLTVSERTARLTVANTGDRTGKQVYQAYLSRAESAIDRPVRWLAGFTAVTLEPGQTRTIDIALSRRAFEHWTPKGWTIEPGVFTLQVGTSVADLPHTVDMR